MLKENYSKIPNKKKKPWSHFQWVRLGLIKATPLERIIMLELNDVLVFFEWLNPGEVNWDRKDMRLFVKELAEKIERSRK